MPSPDMDQVDRRQSDQSRRPLSVATDNMMLEFYKKDGCVFLLFTNGDILNKIDNFRFIGSRNVPAEPWN